MPRETIPKKVRDAVLDEYSHRCAVCAADRPHLQHIDEDATNNSPTNLLPLCPNCHLRDQHNPTRMIETGKLMMFRKFKDPAILKPQFHPIYIRQRFLDEVVAGSKPTKQLYSQAMELIGLIAELEMGRFYARRLSVLLEPDNPIAILYGTRDNAEDDPEIAKQYAAHRAKLRANRAAAQELLIEMLRYQSWANAS